MNNQNKQHGMSILGVIVFVVVAILVLSYFKISIKSLVESPSGQENISYVRGGAVTFWDNHLKEPAEKFWNFFILKFNNENGNNGIPTTGQSGTSWTDF
jgi:hypothetical protein